MKHIPEVTVTIDNTPAELVQLTDEFGDNAGVIAIELKGYGRIEDKLHDLWVDSQADDMVATYGYADIDNLCEKLAMQGVAAKRVYLSSTEE